MKFILIIAGLTGFLALITAAPARDPPGQDFNTNAIWGRAPNRGGPGDVENYDPNQIWGREEANRGSPGDVEN